MTVSTMTIEGYLASADCLGCDKPGQPCVILRTEAYAGPHCARCVMREARKRATAAEWTRPQTGEPPVTR